MGWMRVLCFAVFFCSFATVAAQSPLELERFAVFFHDKAGSPHSVFNPTTFLSPRAVERRHLQDIPITVSDLPVSPVYLNALVQSGARVLNVSKWLNVATVSIPDSNALQIIKSLSYVKDIRVIARYKTPRSDNSTATRQSFQFHYPNQSLNTEPMYGMGLRQIEILNGVGIHRKGYTGEGVVIAVFDAGFNNAYLHPGLQHVFTSERLIATRDFVSNGTVFTGSTHGTQCFSIIANYAPGLMVGTAPEASFVLCRTEDAGSELPIEEYNWAAAAEYVDSLGADIISSSLGYTTFDDSTFNHTYADLDGRTTVVSIAAAEAARKGIIVVNSAGNSGDKAWYFIGAPADADSILAVGAVDANEIAGSFSSHGPTPDGRVKPDVMAMGVRVSVANPGNLDYNTSNGTSFAAPAIAGMAACLVQAHPNRNAHDVMQAIRMSGDRFHNPDPRYGYGIPDMQLADLLLGNVNIGAFASNPSPIVYPNPFRSNVTVVHYSEISEPGRVELVDIFGRLMYTGHYFLQPGYNQLVTGTSALPAGMYVVRFITQSAGYEMKAVRH